MKTKILVVCLGNICRSPLAHGIFEHLLPSNQFEIDSAGTGGYHIGNPPDPRSIAVAKRKGLDISQQKARKFVVEDLEIFDHIYVMDRSNLHNVTSICQHENQLTKVELLTAAAGLNDIDVPDPYYDREDGFEKVYNLIYESCSQIANRLNADSKHK